MMLALADAHAATTITDYVLPTASLLTVGLLTYIARLFRKFRSEHEWLMVTAKDHSKQIDENTRAIRKMLEQREKLIEQGARQPAARRRT